MRGSALERRQRLILALLLAFLIDTTRPVVHPVAHSHGGSGRPHVHLDDAGRAMRPMVVSEDGDTSSSFDGKPGIARAFASDLHFHLLRTLHASHLAPLPPTPAVAVRVLPTIYGSRGERIAAHARHAARAPPILGS